MGKSKQIRPAIPDLITEKTVFFKKRDDGYYNKVTKTILKEKYTFKQTSCVTSVSEEIYDILSDAFRGAIFVTFHNFGAI